MKKSHCKRNISKLIFMINLIMIPFFSLCAQEKLHTKGTSHLTILPTQSGLLGDFWQFLDSWNIYTSTDTRSLDPHKYHLERYRRFRPLFPSLKELLDKQKVKGETQYVIFYRWSTPEATLALTKDGHLNNQNAAFYLTNHEGNDQFAGVGLYFSASPLDNLGYGPELMEILIPVDILLSPENFIIDDDSGDIKDGFVLKMAPLLKTYPDLKRSQIIFRPFSGDGLTKDQVKEIYQELKHYFGHRWGEEHKDLLHCPSSSP